MLHNPQEDVGGPDGDKGELNKIAFISGWSYLIIVAFKTYEIADLEK